MWNFFLLIFLEKPTKIEWKKMECYTWCNLLQRKDDFVENFPLNNIIGFECKYFECWLFLFLSTLAASCFSFYRPIHFPYFSLLFVVYSIFFNQLSNGFCWLKKQKWESLWCTRRWFEQQRKNRFDFSSFSLKMWKSNVEIHVTWARKRETESHQAREILFRSIKN